MIYEIMLESETEFDNEYGQFVDLETVDIYVYKDRYTPLNIYNGTHEQESRNTDYIMYTIHVVSWIEIAYIMYNTIFR